MYAALKKMLTTITPYSKILISKLQSEFEYKAVRSSGAGGQNVNKVSTKVIASFHIQNSFLLTQEEKQFLNKKLALKINTAGYLSTGSQVSRSQLTNKETATKALLNIIEKAFKKPKTRKKSTPTEQSKIERRKSKQHRSETKQSRKFNSNNLINEEKV